MAELQRDISRVLTDYGKLGVLALRTDVLKVSATGKTADSIRFEISIESDGVIVLRFVGRQFFKALETGRGPRRSSEYMEFDLNLLDYMKARGIGADLSRKKREQLAKRMAYLINRDGDKVFQAGGRIVYSETLTKLAKEIKGAIVSDFPKIFIREVLTR